METNRQKKIAGVIQQDIADIIQKSISATIGGILISVTKVRVTSDLSEAKVYISVFPTKDRDSIIEQTIKQTKPIRYQLAQRTKHQLRRVPNLHFFIDDSLDYIDDIDKALRGENIDPIKNPDVLQKRKKIN